MWRLRARHLSGLQDWKIVRKLSAVCVLETTKKKRQKRRRRRRDFLFCFGLCVCVLELRFIIIWRCPGGFLFFERERKKDLKRRLIGGHQYTNEIRIELLTPLLYFFLSVLKQHLRLEQFLLLKLNHSIKIYLYSRQGKKEKNLIIDGWSAPQASVSIFQHRKPPSQFCVEKEKEKEKKKWVK